MKLTHWQQRGLLWQVYERSSIEQHLARHNTDPITGTRLASKVLTPVYFLKSRAAEFREAAARSAGTSCCACADWQSITQMLSHWHALNAFRQTDTRPDGRPTAAWNPASS